VYQVSSEEPRVYQVSSEEPRIVQGFRGVSQTVNHKLQNNFIFKTMRNIVSGQFNIHSLTMPLLLGSNSGLYSVVTPNIGDTSISILIPVIIFTENYNVYFNTLNKIFSREPDKNQDTLVEILGSINKKENYEIINSQIKLFNIINLLLKLALVYQLKNIYSVTTPVIQDNISNIFIDEITNIIKLVPSDKCYSNNSMIKMYPNPCVNNEGFTNTRSSCDYWLILFIIILAYLLISKK
jgi:hypothetical protein